MNRSEWPGTRLAHASEGACNVMTSTSGRLPNACKTLDQLPRERDRVRALAAHRILNGGALIRRDAVIHGIPVTLRTNSSHIARMFEANWFSRELWEAVTFRRPATGPVVSVLALVDVPGADPGAWYSRAESAMWFVNVSFYGQIKSWILGAVGRVLADARRAHSIHGACVEVEGRALLIVAPTGTGKSTSVGGLLQSPGTRFHSDDWVYVRYTGIGRDFAAFAFISERNIYVRTNLVESFPEAVAAFLAADVENVPDAGPEVLELHSDAARSLVAMLDRSDPDLARLSRLWEDIARLMACDHARAMVAPSDLFRGAEAIADPEEGLPIAAVVLLERDETSNVVLERLDETEFLSTLLVGRTPRGGCDTAFNAYRLVDDAAERAYIDARLGDPQALCSGTASRRAPATLRAETAQLRCLHRAAPAFRLNTILTRDGRVPLSSAVRETTDLLREIAAGNAPAELQLADLPEGRPTAA